MRFQSIIVPGWKNSGSGHWQTEWEHSLPHCTRIALPDWDAPDSGKWNSAVAHAVDAAQCPVLLIAHSLGCLAVASLPIALHARVAGALLVAPADVERPDVPDALLGFSPIARQRLTFQSVVVASDNDPYCDLPRADRFAHEWGSRLVVLKQAGHINAEAGYGPWLEGIKLLTALRRRAAWRIQPAAPRISPLPRQSLHRS